MDFYAVLDEVIELVRVRGRVSHRALKEQFGLDDERLETLRAELQYANSGSSGFPIPPPQRGVSNKRWPCPSLSRQSRGSCGQPPAWPESGCTTA
jgi:hypothetical protein